MTDKSCEQCLYYYNKHCTSKDVNKESRIKNIYSMAYNCVWFTTTWAKYIPYVPPKEDISDTEQITKEHKERNNKLIKRIVKKRLVPGEYVRYYSSDEVEKLKQQGKWDDSEGVD